MSVGDFVFYYGGWIGSIFVFGMMAGAALAFWLVSRR